MSEELVTVQEIADRWDLGYGDRLIFLETQAAQAFDQLRDDTRVERLRATLQRQAAYDVVCDEINRFEGTALPHQNRSRTRGVLGLDREGSFEKATAKRAAFDTAEAAKPPPTPARRPVTPEEFKKIKAEAVANGFMDLHVIGKAWGMKWAKTLEYMHFLDPTTKDTVQLIQGSHRKNEHSAVRKGADSTKTEFDRLTEIGEQARRPNSTRSRNGTPRREKVDAEVERLEDEKERYERAKVAAFEAVG